MKQANAKQKQWMSDIAENASELIPLLYGDEFDYFNCQLHHVCGRSAKQNKVAIGHDFILPVPFVLHDVMSNHKDNVTHHKHNFTKRFGMQRELFAKMVCYMKESCYAIPDDEILKAIESTRE